MFDSLKSDLTSLPNLQGVCVGIFVVLWLAWRLDTVLKTATRCPVGTKSDQCSERTNGSKTRRRTEECYARTTPQHPGQVV